jgi:hypothetical protein
MRKVGCGVLLFGAALLLFWPMVMVSIMSSDGSPSNATSLPIIFDVLLGVAGLVLIGWGIVAYLRDLRDFRRLQAEIRKSNDV